MTAPHSGNGGQVNLTGAEYAVMLSRIETLIATNIESRNGFQRYMDRNGDRVTALEKAQIELDTTLRLTREEMAGLKQKADDVAALQITQGNRTTVLETMVADIREIKSMVTAALIGVVVTFIGSLGGIVYLITNRPVP